MSFSPATTEEDFAVLLDALIDLAQTWEHHAQSYALVPGTSTFRHKDDRAARARPLMLSAPSFDPGL